MTAAAAVVEHATKLRLLTTALPRLAREVRERHDERRAWEAKCRGWRSQSGQ